MKIMIGGGYDEQAAHTDDGDRLMKFARVLAKQVILQGHSLRCGNVSSLDELIIEAGCEAARETGRDEENHVISYVPKGHRARKPIGGVNVSSSNDWGSIGGRKPAVPEPIDEADVVILIGGFGEASGTYTAANWARQVGTPILPVGTFGMASRDIFEDLPLGPARQKITGLPDGDLQLLNRAYSILDSDEKIDRHARRIVELAEKAALSREVFVIMSFRDGDDLDDYLAAVKAVCKEAGFDAIRTDTRPSADTHQIIDAIHEGIASCGFVIADLTDGRPNVYYEIGWARGLEKSLILTSKEGTDVEFDLQGFNRVVWRGGEHLKRQLRPLVEEVALSFGLGQRR